MTSGDGDDRWFDHPGCIRATASLPGGSAQGSDDRPGRARDRRSGFDPDRTVTGWLRLTVSQTPSRPTTGPGGRPVVPYRGADSVTNRLGGTGPAGPGRALSYWHGPGPTRVLPSEMR